MINWPAPDRNATPRITLMAEPLDPPRKVVGIEIKTQYGQFHVVYCNRVGRRTSAFRSTFEDALRILKVI